MCLGCRREWEFPGNVLLTQGGARFGHPWYDGQEAHPAMRLTVRRCSWSGYRSGPWACCRASVYARGCSSRCSWIRCTGRAREAGRESRSSSMWSRDGPRSSWRTSTHTGSKWWPWMSDPSWDANQCPSEVAKQMAGSESLLWSVTAAPCNVSALRANNRAHASNLWLTAFLETNASTRLPSDTLATYQCLCKDPLDHFHGSDGDAVTRASLPHNPTEPFSNKYTYIHTYICLHNELQIWWLQWMCNRKICLNFTCIYDVAIYYKNTDENTVIRIISITD